jgi:hypothetical protein
VLRRPRFGRDRVESGRSADIGNRSFVTLGDTYLGAKECRLLGEGRKSLRRFVLGYSLVLPGTSGETTLTPRRPGDFSRAAKFVIDVAAGQAEDRSPTPEERGKDPAWGGKGGQARAKAMSANEEQRSPKRWRLCLRQSPRQVPKGAAGKSQQQARAPRQNASSSKIVGEVENG